MTDQRPVDDIAWLDWTRALRDQDDRGDRLRGRLGVAAGQVVVEIGPGTGEDLQHMAAGCEPGGIAVGVEIAAGMAAEAARRARGVPSAALVVGDATRLPFRDGVADACHAERVLQHVSDMGAVVGEIVRVLRLGGRVSLTEPDQTVRTIDHPQLEVERRVREHAAGPYAQPAAGRQLRRLMVGAGLQVDSVEPVMVWSADYTAFGPAAVNAAVRAADAGVISPVERDGYLEVLNELGATGRFLSTWTAYTVTATRQR